MVDLLQKGIPGKLAWDIKLFPELSAAVQAHAGQIEGPGRFRLIQTGIFQIPARGDKVFLIVLFTFLCVSCPCANAGADFFSFMFMLLQQSVFPQKSFNRPR